MSRQRLALIGLAVVVVLGASVVLGRSLGSSSSPAPPPKDRTTTGASPNARSSRAIPAGFATFRDTQAGFSISYPRGWKRLRASDAGIRLIAADGKRASLLVRIAPVGLDVTQDTLPEVRTLTERLVASGGNVKQVSRPDQVSLDGIPGYRYVYTYSAKDGTRGAHVHYFLFRNKRLITVVLQVPDVQAVRRDSVLLDRVAGSFRIVQ